MLVLPASAVGSNAAVQTATALGGLTAEQSASLGAPLTRGQAARLLTAFSAYRDTAAAQGRTGRLYSDVDSDSPYAVYIRTAVQNGWMTGYSDGSFRPDNAVTLEEACTMALRLLGYDVASLGGTFPSAQLNKASALGLRNDISARQGEVLTLEQGTVLFYNALTAMNGSGQVYASTLGFAVSNGQVDISSVLLDNVKGPFVADAATALPFAPAAIYRNDEVTTSAALSPYDVYYYNESARTLWIYNKRAAGRVTAVALRGLPALLPVRRRRGSGGHAAAGHERRRSLRPHRGRGRCRLLRRGAVLIPHPRGDQQRRGAAGRLHHVHRRHGPHRQRK